MKFLADVNIPQSVIHALVELGHDVLDIKKQNLTAKDTELVVLVKKEKRVILTRDKDFLVLTQFPKYQVPTILIRLKLQTPKHIKEHVLELLRNQSQSTLKRSLTIVKEESADSYPYEAVGN